MKYFFRGSCSFPYIKTLLKVSHPVFKQTPKPVNNLKLHNTPVLMLQRNLLWPFTTTLVNSLSLHFGVLAGFWGVGSLVTSDFDFGCQVAGKL